MSERDPFANVQRRVAWLRQTAKVEEGRQWTIPSVLRLDATIIEQQHELIEAQDRMLGALEAERDNLRAAVEALVDVMPYLHPWPDSPKRADWSDRKIAALDVAASALAAAPPAAEEKVGEWGVQQTNTAAGTPPRYAPKPRPLSGGTGER